MSSKTDDGVVTMTRAELRELVRDAYLDGWYEGGEDSAHSMQAIPGGGGAYGPSDPEAYWRDDKNTRLRAEEFIRRGSPAPVSSGSISEPEPLDHFTRVTRDMARGG